MATWDKKEAGPMDVTAPTGLDAADCTPWVSDFDRLTRSGAVIPSPETLNGGELSTKLWELIGRLAGMSIYLLHTDHLSDRELYERLWGDVLREETPDSFSDNDSEGCWIVDLVGAGSEEDLLAWLTYYASDVERQEFIDELAEDLFPEPERPPHDRDRHLPGPIHAFMTGREREDHRPSSPPAQPPNLPLAS